MVRVIATQSLGIDSNSYCDGADGHVYEDVPVSTRSLRVREIPTLNRLAPTYYPEEVECGEALDDLDLDSLL